MRRRSVLLTARAGLLTAGLGAITAGALTACSPPGNASGAGATPGAPPGKSALIELEKGGSITLQLLPEVAPKTVQNFEDKAAKGFYNGLIFHRVEDWVVQGGDPRGDGRGGGQMPTELSDRPFTLGAVGVARGPDVRVSNDAQFFICTKPANWLDKQYTNFGQVSQGMETVAAIQRGDKIKRITVRG